ncbi:hypothetical protein PROH_16370 [Prochlorothrix hollandica PCC 9006 = CALU 1027]|uniref:Uncharacterized protein n=1 Tax=Prochlorothrix hollandica PCC 9006 = CALU 1027 TaxID=317619 RepID=A0A0M2PW22_PROHO|nr:hypothetical protein PROH_16370 [Prochlorothrix hollandica PCC 9006 = CALU 1027]
MGGIEDNATPQPLLETGLWAAVTVGLKAGLKAGLTASLPPGKTDITQAGWGCYGHEKNQGQGSAMGSVYDRNKHHPQHGRGSQGGISPLRLGQSPAAAPQVEGYLYYSSPKWVVWCAPGGGTPHQGFQPSRSLQLI